MPDLTEAVNPLSQKWQKRQADTSMQMILNEQRSALTLKRLKKLNNSESKLLRNVPISHLKLYFPQAEISNCLSVPRIRVTLYGASIFSQLYINVAGVSARVALGGHDVPKEKILQRCDRALKLIPQLVEVCDILHIYDNTAEPFRIFKKRKDVYFRWCNDFWDAQAIEQLTGVQSFSEYLSNNGKISP